MHPFPGRVFPAQGRGKPIDVILNGFLVAEAYMKPVVIGRERVDGVAGYHIAILRTLKLTEMCESAGHLIHHQCYDCQWDIRESKWVGKYSSKQRTAGLTEECTGC